MSIRRAAAADRRRHAPPGRRHRVVAGRPRPALPGSLPCTSTARSMRSPRAFAPRASQAEPGTQLALHADVAGSRNTRASPSACARQGPSAPQAQRVGVAARTIRRGGQGSVSITSPARSPPQHALRRRPGGLRASGCGPCRPPRSRSATEARDRRRARRGRRLQTGETSATSRARQAAAPAQHLALQAKAARRAQRRGVNDALPLSVWRGRRQAVARARAAGLDAHARQPVSSGAPSAPRGCRTG